MRRKFLAALTRQQKWPIGDALDFQRDLQLYEDLISRNTSTRRRKAFEAANHPFVDRCAFVLDSSFLEMARVAASRALSELESLSESVTSAVLQRALVEDHLRKKSLRSAVNQAAHLSKESCPPATDSNPTPLWPQK